MRASLPSRLLLASVVLSAALPASESVAQEKIKIGVSTALTGEAANYGLDIRDVLDFAHKRNGQGIYELIVEDDRCNAKDAVTVAHKLVDIDKVRAVVGFACSGAALAAAKVYERANVPVMITLASSPNLSQAGDFIFRTTPSDRDAAAILFHHMHKKHQRLGILAEETEYAEAFANAFLAEGRKVGASVEVERYAPGSNDFRSPLLRLKARGVEGLFVDTQAEPAFAAIVKQRQVIGRWEVALYGAYWPGSQAFLKQAGTGAEGIEFVDTPSLDMILTGKGRELREEYEKAYGTIRSIESMFASTYEAFRVMDAAIRSGTDARQFLYKGTFEGIFGPFSFDKNGDIVGMSFVMKRIANGVAIPFDNLPAESTRTASTAPPLK